MMKHKCCSGGEKALQSLNLVETTILEMVQTRLTRDQLDEKR